MATQTMKNENCFPLMKLCRVHNLEQTRLRQQPLPTSTPAASSPLLVIISLLSLCLSRLTDISTQHKTMQKIN